jgi:hypothetical protein
MSSPSIFHREERRAFDFADVVNAADIRVRDLPREPHFVAEPLKRASVGDEARGRKLERHVLTENQVVGAVDIARAAFPEADGDAVPLREYRPRCESFRFESRGARDGRCGAAGHCDGSGFGSQGHGRSATAAG